VARVKKIIAMDEDIAQCSNGAAFAISVATVRSEAADRWLRVLIDDRKSSYDI
jgi:hypothetical protein